METKPKTIIVMGPQGSGKGTQVELLLKDLQATGNPVLHFDTGKSLRALKEEGKELGERVFSFLHAGELVPDLITASLVVDWFRHNYTADCHIVVDGFPRTVEQARMLHLVLDFFDRAQGAQVVKIELTEEETIKRLLARGRHDDNEEQIKKRLAWYNEQTFPSVEWFRGHDYKITVLEGNQSIESVYQEFNKAIW